MKKIIKEEIIEIVRRRAEMWNRGNFTLEFYEEVADQILALLEAEKQKWESN